jgi:hypothetical protein
MKPIGTIAGALLLAACPLAARAETRVDLELVLAVDASRSIDGFEYRLQRQGYARALIHPAVIGAITSGPRRRVAIAYVEWSGAVQQATLVGWAVIDGKAAARAFAAKLTAAPRRFLGGTSISGAIGYSMRMFKSNGIRGARRVIDVSGDGPNNRGVPSVVARDAAVRAGVTINGLAILNDRPSRPPWPEEPVDIHYKTKVIGGPGAFMMVVKGFDAFAAAIRNKLIREIAHRHNRPPRRAAEAGSAGSICARVVGRCMIRASWGRPDARTPSTHFHSLEDARP